MYLKTIIIAVLFFLNIPPNNSQLQYIGKTNEIEDVDAFVLIVDDKCSRNFYNNQCTDFCDFKVINSLNNFKDENLNRPSVIKINKNLNGVGEDNVGNDSTGNQIFLLTDKNVTYRMTLSKNIDSNIYIFNNKTRDKKCGLWILNLDLTGLRKNKIDLEYLHYIESIFENYVNEKHSRNGKSNRDFYNIDHLIEETNQDFPVMPSQKDVVNIVRFPKEFTNNSSAKLMSNTHEKQIIKPRSVNKVNPAPITIETSVRSDLLLKSGSNPKVIFEVTNNMERTIYVKFSARDEKSILINLIPRQGYMMPGQTLPVTVITQLPPNAVSGFSDTISLMAQAQGSYKAEKSALLQRSVTRTQDTWKPSIKYQYTTGCFEVSTGNCESSTWSLEVKAQDKESGLLQLNSIPFGMNVPKEYVSGTKEWVTGYYSDTCCNPYIEIYAIDLNNNKQTYKLDANDLHLSDASIAAIVIAVVLLIVLIIICAVCIRKKYYSDSRELPTYRSEPR